MILHMHMDPHFSFSCIFRGTKEIFNEVNCLNLFFFVVIQNGKDKEIVQLCIVTYMNYWILYGEIIRGTPFRLGKPNSN